LKEQYRVLKVNKIYLFMWIDLGLDLQG